jgi:hypothetical protein
MNKSYRFVESNSGKSNVTYYLYSFPQTYIRQTLFCHTKKEQSKWKNAIF